MHVLLVFNFASFYVLFISILSVYSRQYVLSNYASAELICFIAFILLVMMYNYMSDLKAH